MVSFLINCRRLTFLAIDTFSPRSHNKRQNIYYLFLNIFKQFYQLNTFLFLVIKQIIKKKIPKIILIRILFL